MSEIFSGARYTLGGLVVLSLWGFIAVKFYEAETKVYADALADELAKSDAALLRFGPSIHIESEMRRYDELIQGVE